MVHLTKLGVTLRISTLKKILKTDSESWRRQLSDGSNKNKIQEKPENLQEFGGRVQVLCRPVAGMSSKNSIFFNFFSKFLHFDESDIDGSSCCSFRSYSLFSLFQLFFTSLFTLPSWLSLAGSSWIVNEKWRNLGFWEWKHWKLVGLNSTILAWKRCQIWNLKIEKFLFKKIFFSRKIFRQS